MAATQVAEITHQFSTPEITRRKPEASLLQFRLVSRFAKNTVGLRLRRLEEIAEKQSAPFVSVPVCLSFDGQERTCIIIRRDHFLAAISTPGMVRAEYNRETNRLTISGDRSQYSLISQTDAQAYQKVQERLREWHDQTARRIHAKTISPNVRKAENLAKQIGKLERKLKKIYLQAPVNPICQRPRETDDYCRRHEKTWADGRTIRQRLARLTGPCIKMYARPKWKQFYADAEAICGHPISDSSRHDVITRARHFQGDFIDYLKQFPRYADRQDRPYRPLPRPFDVEEMRRFRVEYLTERNEVANIRTAIKGLEDRKKALLE